MKLLLTLFLSSAISCHAVLTFTMQEVGPDVVITGSGSANTAALSLGSTGTAANFFMTPSSARFIFITGTVRQYSGISGPTSIGSGGAFSTTDTGQAFGVLGATSSLFLPNGYVSGSALFNSVTLLGTDLATIGVTPGTYTWTWGSGATADSATLTVTASVIPEPSTYLAVAGFAGLGLFMWRRRVKRHQAKA